MTVKARFCIYCGTQFHVPHRTSKRQWCTPYSKCPQYPRPHLEPVECACGCGATRTPGHKKRRFINHHAVSLRRKETTEIAGYVFIPGPIDRHDRTSIHVIVAEKALGKPLPAGTIVHHVNGIRRDNRPQNLVICQDAAYHNILHFRQRISDAGGDPDIERICTGCHQVKSFAQFGKLRTHWTGHVSLCIPCSALARRLYGDHRRGVKVIQILRPQ